MHSPELHSTHVPNMNVVSEGKHPFPVIFPWDQSLHPPGSAQFLSSNALAVLPDKRCTSFGEYVFFFRFFGTHALLYLKRPVIIPIATSFSFSLHQGDITIGIIHNFHEFLLLLFLFAFFIEIFLVLFFFSVHND